MMVEINEITGSRLNRLAITMGVPMCQVLDQLVAEADQKQQDADPFRAPLTTLAIHGYYGFAPAESTKHGTLLRRGDESIFVDPSGWTFYAGDGRAYNDPPHLWPERIVGKPTANNVVHEIITLLRLIDLKHEPTPFPAGYESWADTVREKGMAYPRGGLWQVTPWGRVIWQSEP